MNMIQQSNLINATKLVIGQITECEPHPDSDHLHLCKVNIGTEVLDIVCGAPNARTGLKVIVALDGAVLTRKFNNKKRNDKRSRIKWNVMFNSMN